MLRKQTVANPVTVSEVKISIRQQIMFAFFPKHLKKILAKGFHTDTNPLSLIFAPMFLQVKYNTSKTKGTYLYIKIFGRVYVIFQSLNVNFQFEVAQFSINTSKHLARGFLTGGEPFVTEFLLFCFQSSKYKTK